MLGSLLFLSMAVLAGCPNPKYVAASTGGSGQIKFGYIQKKNVTGIIKCQMADDGALSNCRKMTVVLQGE